MNETQENLPQGWAKTSIGHVVVDKVQQIFPPKDLDFVYVDIASIDNETKQIVSPKRIPGEQAPSRARQSIATNDVVVSMTRPNLNAVSIIPADLAGSIASTGFDVLRPIKIEPSWLFYNVRSRDFVREMGELVRGALYPAIKSTDVRNYQIPIPPLNEQKRIVARIEELQTRSRRAKEALEAIPDLLEQLRRSILAAAVSGRLTNDWRVTSTDENTNTSMRHQEGNDGEDIQFPEYWRTYSVGDVLTLIDGDRGPNYPKQDDYKDSGHCLFLSTKNVRKYGFLFDEVVFITEEKHKIQRNGTLERGDVIITTRGTLGNVAVYDEKVPYNVVRINSGMLILRKKDIDLLSDFIRIYIASPYFMEQLNEKRTGSAQPQIPAGILKSFTINVPPLAEQHEIVKRVEELLKIAGQVEGRYFQVKRHLNTIDQSILSKAFHGELVPQDHNDEPAAILLDRVCQEKAREAAQPKAKAIRKAKNHVHAEF